MTKPIFVIELPDLGQQDREEMLSELQEGLTKKLDDYHVLIIVNPLIDETKFQAFYEKDFDEVKFEELKQIIIDKCVIKQKSYNEELSKLE